VPVDIISVIFQPLNGSELFLEQFKRQLLWSPSHKLQFSQVFWPQIESNPFAVIFGGLLFCLFFFFFADDAFGRFIVVAFGW
jgi:hypothetical protein